MIGDNLQVTSSPVPRSDCQLPNMNKYWLVRVKYIVRVTQANQNAPIVSVTPPPHAIFLYNCQSKGGQTPHR